MITKDDVFRLLEAHGVQRSDVVTIHAALRAAGPIEGGADGLIDALKAYLCDGLLLVPTHTWAVVNAANPHFDVRSTVPNIGTLARVAAFRPDAVRSLHPTHSLAVFGRGAREYVQGEERSTTPAPMGGCLSRLYELGGKVLLLGVGHERNTYLHAVDERMNLPNRLRQPGFAVSVTDWDGNTTHVAEFHPHAVAGIPVGCSEFYPNYGPALDACGAVTRGTLGNATVLVCDCRRMTDCVMHLWQQADRDICLGPFDIPEAWYSRIIP
ncbi:MAG: AAC(3) family N-acetyltransferase [Clostridia bacterium]|nr:AAC(3) family N-acetyltransferase [Clostridia bacterium]